MTDKARPKIGYVVCEKCGVNPLEIIVVDDYLIYCQFCARQHYEKITDENGEWENPIPPVIKMFND